MSEQNEMICVERKLLVSLLEPLRLARVYVLMGTEWEETLGSDFKPWKWQGYEKEFADETTAAYRRVMDALTVNDIVNDWKERSNDLADRTQ